MPDFEYVVVSPVGEHQIGEVLPADHAAVEDSPHCLVRRAKADEPKPAAPQDKPTA